MEDDESITDYMSPRSRANFEREFKDLDLPNNVHLYCRNGKYFVVVDLSENNQMEDKEEVKGPEKKIREIWKGGKYEFVIEVPDEYPNRPPRIKALSRIIHPNVGIDDFV